MKAKTFGLWAADKKAMWPTDTPTYLIEKTRFTGKVNGPDSFADWLNHLRAKNWFTPASETDFRRAFEYMTGCPN